MSAAADQYPERERRAEQHAERERREAREGADVFRDVLVERDAVA